MTLSEQIQLIEDLELSHIGDKRKGLAAVKESLRHLMGHYSEVAPKYESYSLFMGAYYDFIIEYVPLFNITGKDGKALKEIIAKLLRCKGIDSEQKALEVFKIILKNWKKLNSFMQTQKSLPQFNKYLVEILDQLNNGHYENKQQFASKQATENVKSASDMYKQYKAQGN